MSGAEMQHRSVAAPVPASRQNTLVTIMFFAAGIVFLDRFGITYLFPDIGPELHLNNSQLGSLASVTAVTWAMSSLVFSMLADRFGLRDKPIIVTSLILFSVTTGLVGMAPDYASMLALRALIGVCEGPALPLIQSAVSRASSPQRRGRNLGIVIAGTAVIGLAAAPGIMIGLGSVLGWRLAFPVIAAAGFAVAILVMIFMRSEGRASTDLPRVRVRDFRVVVANRNVLLALVGTIVCIGWTVGFSAFAPQFLADEKLSPGSATLVLTVFGILSALGSIVAPMVSDRFGRKPALFVAAVGLGLIPLFFVLFAHAVPVLLVSLVVALMAGGALTLITYVVPGESVPASLTATTFALQICVGEIVGGALGPQIGGAIADATGSLTHALLFYAAVPVLLIIVSVLLRETAPRKMRAGREEAGAASARPASASSTRSPMPQRGHAQRKVTP